MADQTKTPAPSNKPKPWRIPLNEAARLLGFTRSGLHGQMKKDPAFPRPIKDGTDRRSRSYFLTEELEAWLDRKAKQRDQRRISTQLSK